MTVEGEDDVIGLRRICAIVAETLRAMQEAAEPGVTTAELDEVGRSLLRARGATSAPQKAYEFPGATCISVNDALAHGVPSDAVRLREGDLVNIDVSAELDGYWGDTGGSVGVGAISERHERLLAATKEARADAIDKARAGAWLNAIGSAVVRRAKKRGFSVIENLGGHGVGRFIHEPPHVSNVPRRGERTRLHEGLVLAIEPFLTTGATEVREDADGWTLRTPDGTVGAQFEHTVIVTQGAPIVLTQLSA